jgi:hypothetical protein
MTERPSSVPSKLVLSKQVSSLEEHQIEAD